MSGLAAYVAWDGRRVADEVVRAMLERVRHRGPDGLEVAVEGAVGLGHAHNVLRRAERAWPQPLFSGDGALAVTADVRLYDRDALVRRLGDALDAAEPSDAALLLAAYRAWGEDMLQVVDGDFAFVIWDARARRVFAARDAFGVKPLFFHTAPRRLLLASEVKQILAVEGVPRDVDDLVVGEFLFGRFEDTRHTFFEAVRRLRPAHCLVADEAGWEERRWWNPGSETEVGDRDHDAHVATVRDALRHAVRRRLGVEVPVMAELSGGMDSSSLVAVAGALYREGGRALPPFETISDVFDGLPCDESPYIEAVTRSVPFPSHVVRPLSASALDGLEEELERLDSPWADLQRASFNLHVEVFRERHVRVLTTGLGGDELFHTEYYLRDLARRRRFGPLLVEAWRGSRVSHHAFARLLADALWAAAAAPLQDAARRLRGRSWRPPAWAAPSFARWFGRLPEAPAPTPGGYPSLTQEWAFRWLTYPGITWALEALELRAAHAGLEARHPLLDRRLAEAVLAVPFHHRRLRGHWKRLLQEAVEDVLPAVVWRRRRKTMFTSFDQAALEEALPGLRRRLGAPKEWVSARYVRPRGAARLLGPGPRPARARRGRLREAWQLACLELWLRRR